MHWFITEQTPDIIVLPVGVREPDEELHRLLQKASRCGILIFAAACDKASHVNLTWPAITNGIFAFHPTDLKDSPTFYGLDPRKGHCNFATFGEMIQNSMSLTVQGFRTFSETSVSAVIGAAIAATIIQLAREGEMEPEVEQTLRTFEGMSRLLMRLGTDVDGYCCLSPHSLREALGRDPISRVREWIAE